MKIRIDEIVLNKLNDTVIRLEDENKRLSNKAIRWDKCKAIEVENLDLKRKIKELEQPKQEHASENSISNTEYVKKQYEATGLQGFIHGHYDDQLKLRQENLKLSVTVGTLEAENKILKAKNEELLQAIVNIALKI